METISATEQLIIDLKAEKMELERGNDDLMDEKRKLALRMIEIDNTISRNNIKIEHIENEILEIKEETDAQG